MTSSDQSITDLTRASAMRNVPVRIAAALGLGLLGVLMLATSGWGVLAIINAGPSDDALRNGLAVAFARWHRWAR